MRQKFRYTEYQELTLLLKLTNAIIYLKEELKKAYNKKTMSLKDIIKIF